MNIARLRSRQHRRLISRYVLRIAAVLTGALALGIGLTIPAYAAIPDLGPGSTGTAVEIWQQDLNLFILLKDTCHPTLTVDGDYGPNTTNATKCFQSLRHISVDGIEGPQTRTQMCLFLEAPTTQDSTLYNETCT